MGRGRQDRCNARIVREAECEPVVQRRQEPDGNEASQLRAKRWLWGLGEKACRALPRRTSENPGSALIPARPFSGNSHACQSDRFRGFRSYLPARAPNSGVSEIIPLKNRGKSHKIAVNACILVSSSITRVHIQGANSPSPACADFEPVVRILVLLGFCMLICAARALKSQVKTFLA